MSSADGLGVNNTDTLPPVPSLIAAVNGEFFITTWVPGGKTSFASVALDADAAEAGLDVDVGVAATPRVFAVFMELPREKRVIGNIGDCTGVRGVITDPTVAPEHIKSKIKKVVLRDLERGLPIYPRTSCVVFCSSNNL